MRSAARACPLYAPGLTNTNAGWEPYIAVRYNTCSSYSCGLQGNLQHSGAGSYLTFSRSPMGNRWAADVVLKYRECPSLACPLDCQVCTAVLQSSVSISCLVFNPGLCSCQGRSVSPPKCYTKRCCIIVLNACCLSLLSWSMCC